MPSPDARMLELHVERWLNTDRPITPEDLRGKVVALHAFQMLCPGCVSHGLPMAQRIHDVFDHSDVAVIGLHSVFEHHDVMGPAALAAFVHEYRWAFPIGIDQPGREGGLPVTMAAYAMRGTPSLLLFDRQGRLRHHGFGHEDDMRIGALIMALVSEAPSGIAGDARSEATGGENRCTEKACRT